MSNYKISNAIKVQIFYMYVFYFSGLIVHKSLSDL